MFLILRLEGPLQSWGLESRWDFRDTGYEPSKSGIVGLIACAMGLHRFDPKISKMEQQTRMAVRIEKPGQIIRDFQTIQGGVQQADGKIRSTDNTIVSPKMYLVDASFLVVITGEKSILKEMAQALKNPKWIIYLGRKSCVPTRPIFCALNSKYTSLEDALKRIPWEPLSYVPSKFFFNKMQKGQDELLRCVVEDFHGSYMRPDKIPSNQSRISRMFEQRQVNILWVKNPGLSAEFASVTEGMH